jgi:hypothetical protein
VKKKKQKGTFKVFSLACSDFFRGYERPHTQWQNENGKNHFRQKHTELQSAAVCVPGIFHAILNFSFDIMCHKLLISSLSLPLFFG